MLTSREHWDQSEAKTDAGQSGLNRSIFPIHRDWLVDWLFGLIRRGE